MAQRHLPALLIIMDGCGLAPADGENAVAAAKTPFLDSLYEKYPHTTLGASGEDVGLPDGQMGNSEVGHLNIGAGRIVFQELSRINNAIKDGSIAKNEVFVKAMDDVKAEGKTLHLMGLMSPGGVHSHMNHVEALVKMAAEHGVKTVRVHAFMDGRDVDPQEVLKTVKERDIKLVGLSALMTTTVVAMEETIKLLHAEVPGVKIIVGGAVLTPEYAKQIGADYYAKDAHQSVEITRKVMG